MLSAKAGGSGGGSVSEINNASVSVKESGEGGQGTLASPTSSLHSVSTRKLILAGNKVGTLSKIYPAINYSFIIQYTFSKFILL